VPTLEIPLLPGIALAGVIRPRVLIGSSARDVLTAPELDVAVAHEIAHWHAGDNVARVLMACIPDVFSLTSSARRVERLWEGEAECLADARAVAGSPERATRLASALVKVARLVARPGDVAWSPGWSSFHHAALLETRVRLLIRRPPVPERVGGVALKAAAALAALVAAAWLGGVPYALHTVTEALLMVLP
jgi:beta-lactamase regulating signal transducer with metallopeptidase domain